MAAQSYGAGCAKNKQQKTTLADAGTAYGKVLGTHIIPHPY